VGAAGELAQVGSVGVECLGGMAKPPMAGRGHEQRLPPGRRLVAREGRLKEAQRCSRLAAHPAGQARGRESNLVAARTCWIAGQKGRCLGHLLGCAPLGNQPGEDRERRLRSQRTLGERSLVGTPADDGRRSVMALLTLEDRQLEQGVLSGLVIASSK
jgi:hypothetical protein